MPFFLTLGIYPLKMCFYENLTYWKTKGPDFKIVISNIMKGKVIQMKKECSFLFLWFLKGSNVSSHCVCVCESMKLVVGSIWTSIRRELVMKICGMAAIMKVFQEFHWTFAMCTCWDSSYHDCAAYCGPYMANQL